MSTAYTGKPTRIYLIGTDGRVAHNPGSGPFGFDPERLEEAIEDYPARDQAEGGLTFQRDLIKLTCQFYSHEVSRDA